jgi:hypothetical protein
MARKLSDAMSEGSNVDPAIIQNCLAEYTSLNSEMKRLAQRQAAMLARYEGQGVNRKSIKVAHKASMMDGASARSQAKTDIRYMIIAGILNPANEDWVRNVTQSDMFTEDEQENNIGVVEPGLAKVRAYNDGYNTGRHGGEAANNQFQPGTQEFVQWEKGRMDGTADRNLKPTQAKGKTADTSTEKRSRGRPKGATGTRKKAAGNGAEEAHA